MKREFQFRTSHHPGLNGIEAVPEGTRLRLEHTGFQGLAGLALSQLLGSGWNSRILRVALPRVLDRMREQSAPEAVS